MDSKFDAFVLYYNAFHERELTTKEFKEMLIAEVGEDGFKETLAIFRQKWEERQAAGDKRTLYEVMKSEKSS